MTKSYDIAVIGAGPAGANAAIEAAGYGARVVVLDEQPRAGGQVWRAKSAAILAAPETPENSAGNALREGLSGSSATHLSKARVWQIERDGQAWGIHFLQEGRAASVSAKLLIIAAGAQEYVQPIPGWTTPGVIGLAGATALMKQEMTLPGQATVVAGSGPLVFFVASEIRRLGGQVAGVVTSNRRRDWLRALPAMAARADLAARGGVWLADLMLARVPIFWGSGVTHIAGEKSVSGLGIAKLDASGAPRGDPAQISADSLCLGNGLIPSIEAAQLAGAAITYQGDLGGWVPKAEVDGTTDTHGLIICGDGAGIRGAAAAELQGKLAGQNAARQLGLAVAPIAKLAGRFRAASRFGVAMTALSKPKPSTALTTPEAIVCRCESLTRAMIEAEIASGAQSANAVKSGLRAGMGPCGGKFCQTAIAALVAQARGGDIKDVPPPTPRPPLRPVPTAALAGDFDYDDLPIPKPAPL
ncbi:NAD(P)/FAD-dependent oxidoreductase [Sulfitobacter donghicola]|uniref:Uncharacterized protein n=1 Tax=Sulfitobacter donghicola DSW-25 = KCTC 12864 = JCM 14565 TaxID=1300350 RepID=A0A073ISC8_9RHOB|nr:NAD(P)/FAD-dependent oxidoreductase [Sulfitobacter donghicola]KEJ88302.1 hypothetical protein DSW25_16635 [Sulfitobacter donghicola DSW-25 = KCTC 12864 = JCM 14565]KIN68898.1 D-Octopine oxidase [Sulfitobacter donghicola DSW-25 = KCTC 12864 = JCM 14565]